MGRSIASKRCKVCNFCSFQNSRNIPSRDLSQAREEGANVRSAPSNFPFKDIITKDTYAVCVSVICNSNYRPNENCNLARKGREPISIKKASYLIMNFVNVNMATRFTVEDFDGKFVELGGGMSNSFSRI